MPEARIKTAIAITYHTQYGTVPRDTVGYKGYPLEEKHLPVLTYEGYKFIGWYYDEAFTQEAKVGDIVGSDSFYLYAKWVEVPTVKSKMTAIADEIRELSGTTGTMGLDAMATHIGEANTEIDSQVELLAQAVAALEGKAASSADTSVEDSLIAGDICVYENDRVTTIRQAAFASCSSLVEISFPKVTSIGAFAFQDCYGLLTASFPETTYIGEKAFAFCSSLATVSFPAATTIGYSAFQYCSNLTTASFPAVTSISGKAFFSCKGLIAADFPVATYIGSSAFWNCCSLTTASFPKALTIDWDAFYNCSGLTAASFPLVTSIYGRAFSYCRNLTTASFPAVTSIGGSAFMGCSSLTTVSFPKAVLIGTAAFMNCSSLTAVSFPKAGSISKDAFAHCAELTTASFPQATIIHNQAFSVCYNLKSLYLTNSSVCTLSASAAFFLTPIGGYSTSAGTYGSIYVPASLLTAYQTATNWTYFSSRFVGI